MSHFNCLYQMTVALISRLHKELKSFKPPKAGKAEQADEKSQEKKII